MIRGEAAAATARWLMLAALACGRGSQETDGRAARATAELECASVVWHVRDVLTLELGSMPGAASALARALPLLERSCREDAWPPALRRCLAEVPLYGAAGGVAGLERCAPHAPAVLRRKLEDQARAL
ncbi:MAG: hypothetical protein R3B48_00395 [Kofleriaceae bacterium]